MIHSVVPVSESKGRAMLEKQERISVDDRAIDEFKLKHPQRLQAKILSVLSTEYHRSSHLPSISNLTSI
jgi:hypothetical protein